ncbi:RnfABCDGE type electron transport complex subunit G [Anaeromicropila populeti]|uniref:Ion-translocating oxidoreductase complex subunit G n=1 Tax=Anaeromicropila populeti TaxID=37658 RepID=A0A1I6I9U2_9FIRM|nr:RnfABCDGE type electron transport complex subunit G [Anaeromicropila populeti]SFR63408.1 electron transport complex protein RnfG [Anaeromicropila populeti]
MENKTKKKNTLVKDAVILFAITLVAGLLLGVCYGITKEPIKEANEKAKQEAYANVFSEADNFVADEGLKALVDNSAQFFTDNDITGAEMNEVLYAVDNSGTPLGYVMSFAATEGYGGNIEISMGIDFNGMITGFEVLSMSETAGLGAKCTTSDFKNQFVGIQADAIEYTKTGKTKDNEIDAISSATITTKAVTKGVNAALAFAKNCNSLQG